ncbi:MAG: diguanylate cyclase, partial [Desulfobacterales bacterium]|nr:diguanylate cyclase [Desulfobacterales bacterium]
AIAENNRDIVASFYEQAQNNLISTRDAKEKAREILLSQPIGKSGYIYCINHAGIIQVHPKKELLGTDLSANEFIRIQKIKKEGYIEYNWANPGEKIQRPKALYMTYFAPWDWIISVSSYTADFHELLSVDDFQKYILSISFGKTGYPYVMDSQGLLVIHPKLQGTNIYDSIDDNGRMFIKEICAKKNGKIIYPWKNPDEQVAREKLVIFNYIPELDWIVASSSYLKEFYNPLTTIAYSMLATIGIMLVLIIPLTWLISSRLARPLQEMINVFADGARADFSSRLDVKWGGEMGAVATNYNRFIDTLEKTRHELVDSEEKFRSIFENSVESIFQITREGQFKTVNPAMAHMFGFPSPEALIASVTNFWHQLCVDPAQADKIIQILEASSVLAEYQIQLFQKDKTKLWCLFNAKAYKDKSGKIKYVEGYISDITRRKLSEEALKRSHDELEKRVVERTRELSSWVEDLEQRNSESALLRKMSEMIQVCNTTDEIFGVMEKYLIRFFPGTAGQLSVFEKDQPHLAPVVSWGDLTKDTRDLFLTDDCWALRQGKPYFMQKTKTNLFCSHLGGHRVTESLCTPLIVREDVLGLLHIQVPEPSFHSPGPGSKTMLESRQSLALIIAEHLALSLVNMKLRESLKRQSILDPLTGLYNRRFFDESLKREAYSMNRHNYAVGIIMIDVDHFKKLNDTYGHECGDAVLRELGLFLKKSTRGNDIACRYGGEEFVLILIKAGLKETLKKAEKLCQSIREELEIHYQDANHSITVSVGAALCRADQGETIEKTLNAADTALYQAKHAGRNQVAWRDT